MSEFKNFVGLFPVQKTLRFELIPQGRTIEELKKSDIFEDDEKRARAYPIVKNIVDEYHKSFIDECLSNVELDWNPLANAMKEYKVFKDKKSKNSLESEQAAMRKNIVGVFKNDQRFEDIFSEKLFSKYISKIVEDDGDGEKIDALKTFNRFSGYFIGLHENRSNIYSDEDISTAVAHRIVNENFSKFLENIQKYEVLKVNASDALSSAELELNQYGMKLDEIFSIGHYNKVLRQKGIDEYNLMIGGVATDTKKIRGVNEFLNLHHQSEKSNGDDKSKRIRMSFLFKQILSDRNKTYNLKAFETDDDVLEAINSFYAEMDEKNLLDRALNLIEAYESYNPDEVFVGKQGLTKISIEIFGKYDVLEGLMEKYKAEEIGDPYLEKTRKKVNGWLSSKEFTLSEILKAINISESGESFDTYTKNISDRILTVSKEKEDTCLKNGTKISGDSSLHVHIKRLLDSIQDVLHMLRPFSVETELQRDAEFYSEFEVIYENLREIIPLYNKTRNYITKKKVNTKKIKLNFGNPTLASGWDLNKEQDNTSIILIRGGKYYLGIMEPKKKIKTWPVSSENPEKCYRKMVYKLLPGPNKMLPKVFFSKKSIDYYNPSQEILDGYNGGKHKKGETFDLDFCHKLIDFFKESIEKHPDWKNFDFKFSSTESYEDISQFYKEVEKQGYKVSFVNISSDVIDEYVHDGRLFLFQIYSKDFSNRSKSFSASYENSDGEQESKKGNPNMHTLYWNAAFSEENLKDVVVKINGEAELFYREKSDIEKIVHKKGEILVNRTTIDTGEPIPEGIYLELSGYLNGRVSDLSDDARKYLDRVGKSKANYDIIKDRRYLEDKLYFHIPLTLNFKADNSKNLNRMVIEQILSSKDAHIIGIDRGERNLIYASVINRNGEIIYQESFNVLGGYDYHEKLDQREKERNEARRSWDAIGRIKDLKEGYISKAVHEISKMILEYNAIVVMEDLNFGFKRGRFKVEKQVYQKFEQMLIDKLNYLVFKGNRPESEGGVLKAYQLTNPLESFAKLGKQSGVLFYVPAAYTSKIDPTTGFVDIFSKANTTNSTKYLGQFKSLIYDAAENAFAFTFDYNDFDVSVTSYKTRWTVYTKDEWKLYSREKRDYFDVHPTRDIQSVLSEYGIVFKSGEDILPKILAVGKAPLTDKIVKAFKNSIRLRHTDRDRDDIQSPVKNKKGRFFATGADKMYPLDADANGAYHIALKGELMLRQIEAEYDPNAKKFDMPRIEIAKWLEFVQTRNDD
jgi:CRISPR-associated protein Cpf1